MLIEELNQEILRLFLKIGSSISAELRLWKLSQIITPAEIKGQIIRTKLQHSLIYLFQFWPNFAIIIYWASDIHR